MDSLISEALAPYIYQKISYYIINFVKGKGRFTPQQTKDTNDS